MFFHYFLPCFEWLNQYMYVQNDLLVLSDLYNQIYMFDCFQLFHLLLASLLLVEMQKLKMSIKPWEKFYIPNVKTNRLTYYNSITENVHKSAYAKKQSSFQAYLEGQRKFRWGVKVELENVQKIFESYQSGVVPKENINLERYQSASVPDVKVEDVGKCQRACKHVDGALLSVRNMKEKLMARRKELLDVNLAPKDWVHDEVGFIDTSVEQVTPILNEVEKLVYNLQFLLSQLRKRFDAASVLQSEMKRSARWQKEQRSKVAKKKRMRTAIIPVKLENYHDSKSSDSD